MKTLSAREIIKKEYGNESKNFMTPKIIKYGKIHKYMAYELSMGTGMNHDIIYGISVASYYPKTNESVRETSLSKCCFSRDEVEDYIDHLKKIHIFRRDDNV